MKRWADDTRSGNPSLFRSATATEYVLLAPAPYQVGPVNEFASSCAVASSGRRMTEEKEMKNKRPAMKRRISTPSLVQRGGYLSGANRPSASSKWSRRRIKSANNFEISDLFGDCVEAGHQLVGSGKKRSVPGVE